LLTVSNVCFLPPNSDSKARPNKPHGCLVVLSALQVTDVDDTIGKEMRGHREENMKMLLSRLKRGVVEGDLSTGLDLPAIAAFYLTVQQGMSIQARDGASRKTLVGVADCAMKAWNGFVAS
jgi:hypothetical protein